MDEARLRSRNTPNVRGGGGCCALARESNHQIGVISCCECGTPALLHQRWRLHISNATHAWDHDRAQITLHILARSSTSTSPEARGLALS